MNDNKEEKILKEFGRRLQKLRKAKKLSYRKLADEADLASSFIQKLESGQSNPSYTTLLKLAEVLNVELSDFSVNKID